MSFVFIYSLAAYEELYRKMKAQSMEDYKAALNEQVMDIWVHVLVVCMYLVICSLFCAMHVHTYEYMYRL